MDTLQQSPLYAEYIKRLGWTIETVDATNIFIKYIPFIGGFAKLQRIGPLPDQKKIIDVFKQKNIRQAVIEAREDMDQQQFIEWVQGIKQHIKVIESPYIPTKTIRIDLQPSEEEIFHQFSEAKRRAVRRAEKNNLRVVINQDISTMIRVKNRSAGFLGFITTKGLKELWETYKPDHAACVIVSKNKPIASIFLLFNNTIAYYWIAGATKEGKKLFAPTLASWEAIKYAKQHGAQWFDWVGVWDERFPHQHHDWKGFTKFKEGFGGKTIYYPVH